MAAKKKNKGGRPTKMTKGVLLKLEQAFIIGASDLEACFYADISSQTFYTYQKKHPEFLERKERLKENTAFEARITVNQAVQDDPDIAFKYLKSKKSNEFSEKIDHTLAPGKDEDGKPVKWEVQIVDPQDTDTKKA